MTEQILQVVRDILLVGGALGVLIGSLGILRFPDFFARIHAAGITETVGMGFIVTGLMIEVGASINALKLLIILLLILFTSPTASHALAKAAIHANLSPLPKNGGNQQSN